MTALTKMPKGFDHAQILFSIKQLMALFGMTRKEVLGFLQRQGVPSFLDGKRRLVTFDGICQASAPIASNLLLIWGLRKKSTEKTLARTVRERTKTAKGEGQDS